MSYFGQRLIIGFKGSNPSDIECRMVQNYLKQQLIGGVILFDFNMKDRHQLNDLIQSFYQAAFPYQPWIAIDQEGGLVQRLSSKQGFNSYPSAAEVAQNFSYAQATEIYYEMALELKELGFNLNFGPVVDLNHPFNKNSPVIGDKGRSYGCAVSKVTTFARAFVEGHRRAGIMTCLKHYPGHGMALHDSHQGFVDITDTYQDYEESPFVELAQSDHADMIMMAHLHHQHVDLNYPASLSHQFMIKLRNYYQGVVISDDFHMGAIVQNYSLSQVLENALGAGLDLMIFSNNEKAAKNCENFQSIIFDIQKLHDIVNNLLKNHALNSQLFENSNHRLSTLRSRYIIVKN